VYEPGSTDRFGDGLGDRPVKTLTYVVGADVKAIAALLPL